MSNAACAFCRDHIDNPTPCDLPAAFLYAPDIYPDPNIAHGNRVELEGKLQELFDNPSPNLLLRIIKDVVGYHQPCIDTILSAELMMFQPPPTYVEFKEVVDDIIPMIGLPMGWNVALPLPTGIVLPDEAQLEENFQMVLLSWLFFQHFGNDGCPHVNAYRFEGQFRTISVLRTMKWLARMVNELLGVIVSLAPTGGRVSPVSLGDDPEVFSIAPVHDRFDTSAEMLWSFNMTLGDLEGDVMFHQLTWVLLHLHMAIRMRRDLPRLFHPEVADAIDLLCDGERMAWEEMEWLGE
ncbi:hypothetical protein B0T14DRAFT_561467 [Immersiella caudata]|uniref:Uncharacterized protein n=1 Tax=Immersiella caudata TaxID=314043 RepID=A0AA39XH67_9PEZI|nr:hypothetical protein B0T14DRAFT_561467 [Immersiella caudata]